MGAALSTLGLEGWGTTLGGWAVISLIGVLIYLGSQSKKGKQLAAKGAKSVESRAPKAKRPKNDGAVSSGNQEVKSGAKPQKRKPQASRPDQAAESAPRAQVNQDDRDDEVDDREFARQLASVKTGTVMAPKSQSTTKQKSVRQSRAQEKAPVETSSDNATAPSSATGGDADDDQSSLNSPELSATTMGSPVNVRNP
jgi:hypothetical protein